ncbi:hypothetical protein MIB92_11330 [Aestuariirhabdus sp. Z084]|uniref:hypothetical protein n=1 Tax=Aestuariirhabdus haliotis TaxID=2918751 RepID=UPI00201B3EEE|nr:hypothetical protein [Aestuariirhabdus haliotis]MCL6416245.1 hypothetical protein [Aestuariirhabdus haliotis]MCL6420295.1 hypothetical protein [Aestuariirhabdus haliotis]
MTQNSNDIRYEPERQLFHLRAHRAVGLYDVVLTTLWGTALGVVVVEGLFGGIPWQELGAIKSLLTMLALAAMFLLCLWRLSEGVRSLVLGVCPRFVLRRETLLGLKYQPERGQSTYAIALGNQVITRVTNLQTFLDAWQQATDDVAREQLLKGSGSSVPDDPSPTTNPDSPEDNSEPRV